MSCPIHHHNRTTSRGIARAARPPAPGPNSLMWREISDALFYPSFLSVLLIEVAHPDVAAAIEKFSIVEEDPWGRADRTLAGAHRLIHGGRHGNLAHLQADQLRELHRNFKGTHDDGSKYFALSPQAYRIVPDSILDHLIHYRELIGDPYSMQEKHQLYAEYLQLCGLLGLRETDIEPDLESFQRYFKDLCENRLTYNETVKKVIKGLAYQPPKPSLLPLRKQHWDRWTRKHLGPTLENLTIGFFNTDYRRANKIPWSVTDQQRFDKTLNRMRIIYRRTPRRLRRNPYALMMMLGIKASPTVTWNELQKQPKHQSYKTKEA